MTVELNDREAKLLIRSAKKCDESVATFVEWLVEDASDIIDNLVKEMGVDNE